MACADGTYNVGTSSSHSPTWSGQLSIAGGAATWTPTGGSGVSVVAQCGTDNVGAWIQFTNTSASPAVHYKKAHWVAANSDYEGNCDNNAGRTAGDTDTWTATPQNRLHGPIASVVTGKKAVKKGAAKKAAKKAAPKTTAKTALKKAAKKVAKKATKKAVKKAAPKKTARKRR